MDHRKPVTIDQGFGNEVDISAYQAKAANPAEAPAGALSVASFGGVVTAQRVAVPRDLERVKNKIKVLAQMGGDKYYYHWMVKEKSGKRSPVQGLSKYGANDVAREWGNNQIDIRVMDEGQYWTFYARFTDLETGYTLTRPFRQRKGSNIGEGYDAERKVDMVFQIGASKAIRNVTVNALQTVCDFAFEEAMNSVKRRVAANPDGARKHLQEQIGKLNIPMERVARIYQRQPAEWTVPDMARLFAELQSIAEGMATIEDVFPTEPVDVGQEETTQDWDIKRKVAPAAATATTPAPGDQAPQEPEFPRRFGPGKLDWEDRDGIRYGLAIDANGVPIFGWSKQHNMPSHADGSFRAARGRQQEAEAYRRMTIQAKVSGSDAEGEPETQVTSPADTDAWQDAYEKEAMQKANPQEGPPKDRKGEWDLG